MKKNHIIALSIAGGIIILSSTLTIFQSATQKDSFPKTTISPQSSTSVKQTVTNTTIPSPEEKYKILLRQSVLELYENGIIIKQTTISPDVFPRADIKALTQGISYSSAEKALTDWESLCN